MGGGDPTLNAALVASSIPDALKPRKLKSFEARKVVTIRLSEIFEEFNMVYPTDEDPQDKVLVEAINDRLKEQKHGQNMSDRITSRNRGTLPKTIYDFINQIVGEVTTLQHHQGNAARWADEGRERHRGGYDKKDEEIGKIVTGHI